MSTTLYNSNDPDAWLGSKISAPLNAITIYLPPLYSKTVILSGLYKY